MSLGHEILDALALLDHESVLDHWAYRHQTCVLTNRRVVLLSPHHILQKPHHEVTWNQALEEIQVLEVEQAGGLDASLTYTNTSAGRPAGRFGGMAEEFPGVRNTEHLAGDFIVTVDNAAVYAGGPDAATKVRDRIERAAEDCRKALGVPRVSGH